MGSEMVEGGGGGIWVIKVVDHKDRGTAFLFLKPFTERQNREMYSGDIFTTHTSSKPLYLFVIPFFSL